MLRNLTQLKTRAHKNTENKRSSALFQAIRECEKRDKPQKCGRIFAYFSSDFLPQMRSS